LNRNIKMFCEQCVVLEDLNRLILSNSLIHTQNFQKHEQRFEWNSNLLCMLVATICT